MGLRPLEIFQFFQRRDHLYTSESDVKKDSCAEMVKCNMLQQLIFYLVEQRLVFNMLIIVIIRYHVV